MTVHEWQVVSVGTDDAPDAFVLGLAENADGDGRILLFQAPPTNPDRSSAWDEYDSYVIVNENQALTTGGVLRVAITGHRLAITLSTEAAAELGWAQETLALGLSITAAERDELVRALHRVLRFSRPDARAVLEVDGEPLP